MQPHRELIIRWLLTLKCKLKQVFFYMNMEQVFKSVIMKTEYKLKHTVREVHLCLCSLIRELGGFSWCYCF